MLKWQRFLVAGSSCLVLACQPRKFHEGGSVSDIVVPPPERCVGPNPAMQYVPLCGPERDGRPACKCISRLVMGTDHLGNFWEQEGFPERGNQTDPNVRKVNAKGMMDYAFLQKGLNFFDTSPIYVDGIENTLGEWAEEKRRENRPPVFVLTKGGFPHDVGPGTYNSRLRGTAQNIVESISEEIRWSRQNVIRPKAEPELKKFEGNIDVYLMHRDDITFRDYQNVTPTPQTPAGTILEALSDTRIYPQFPFLDGRSLRSHYSWIGVSNWKTPRVNEALAAAAANPNLLKPMINSPYFSLFEMDPQVTIHSGGVQVLHGEMMDPNFQRGIFIMPYSPLGGYPIIDRGTPAQKGRDAWENAKSLARDLDNNRDRYWGNVFRAVFTAENEGRFYRVWELSQRFPFRGRLFSIDQWMNAYVLAHPRTNLLAVGPIYKQHLDRTVDALPLAEALSRRPDLLDWMHHGTVDKMGSLPPLQ